MARSERLDAAALARWRSASLGLAAPSYSSPTEVVTALVASQAQDLLPGRWSLAQRCTTVPHETAVEQAHDAGHFVRTHTLRPTWHFVAADALAMVLAATSARVRQATAYMNRQVGVDHALMETARPVIEERLAAGPATRDEIGTALAAAGIETTGIRPSLIVMWAELEGWIASGPARGKQQTYRLLPPLDAWEEAEAQAALARVYLRTRGPVTDRDFAAWASLTLTQARRALESAEPMHVEAGGRVYLTTSEPPSRATSPVASLLQAYDELVMSYSASRDVLTGGATLWDLPARTFMHALAVDGRLVGHWRYDRDGAGRPAAVTVRLHRPLTGAERDAVDAEVARFGAFAGRPATWSIA